MYSTTQIPILNKIIYLRDSGFNVTEIAAALDHLEDDAIIKQLDDKVKEIEHTIRIEQEKRRKIEIAKKELQSTKNDIHYNISIKSIPGYPVLTLRRRIPDYYSEGALWKELSVYLTQQQVSACDQTFTIYHDVDYREKDVDVELCVPVKKLGISEGDYVYRMIEPVPTMVYGSFTNIAGAYVAFAEWLQLNSQYRMVGLSRQIVHRGPWNEVDPEKYLVELQIPLHCE